MDSHAPSKEFLPQADLYLGIGGIEFFPPASLMEEQQGYQTSDWDKSWLIMARDSACGDPIFIDQSHPEWPVHTAKHGMGSWEPVPIAGSWVQFLAALEFIRPYTRNREHPAGLEENPLSPAERQALEKGLGNILGTPIAGFWDLLLAPGRTLRIHSR